MHQNYLNSIHIYVFQNMCFLSQWLLCHCHDPPGPSYSHLLASPHTIVCVGFLVVILVSFQSAHSLKQNKILRWYVPCELESLQLLSSALKLFYGILFSFSHCCDLSSRRQYYTNITQTKKKGSLLSL